jgi:hypothetical protein
LRGRRFKGGQAVIASFHAEAAQGNTGYPTARQALLQQFTHEQAAAPTRAAAFLQGTVEEQQRIRADVGSVAQFLLGV